MAYSKETVTFDDVECGRDSEKAIFVSVDGKDPIWIPKSQIDDDSEVYEAGTSGKLIVTEWIAKEKGLI